MRVRGVRGERDARIPFAGRDNVSVPDFDNEVALIGYVERDFNHVLVAPVPLSTPPLGKPKLEIRG